MVRLSTMITNQSYPNEFKVALFHGTTTYYLDSFRKNGIKLLDTGKKKDFGVGFYLTTHYWQALDYAIKYGVSTDDPIIIGCYITLGDLRSFRKSLIIDDYNQKWMEIIVRGRCESANELSKNYDWIYGRCGDGKTSIFNRKLRECNNDYKILLSKMVPQHLTPNPNLPHYEYDQLWIGSYEALHKLKNPHIVYNKGVEYIDIKTSIQS